MGPDRERQPDCRHNLRRADRKGILVSHRLVRILTAGMLPPLALLTTTLDGVGRRRGRCRTRQTSAGRYYYPFKHHAGPRTCKDGALLAGVDRGLGLEE